MPQPIGVEKTVKRKPRPPQKHPRAHTERKGDSDPYISIGRLAGLIGWPAAAILGQAELIGEPIRHYVTITAIVMTTVWAYCTRPDFLTPLMKAVRGKWMK